MSGALQRQRRGHTADGGRHIYASAALRAAHCAVRSRSGDGSLPLHTTIVSRRPRTNKRARAQKVRAPRTHRVLNATGAARSSSRGRRPCGG